MLLLCEVAVKPWLELTDANYGADEYAKKAKKLYGHSLLPHHDFHSQNLCRATKGVGRTQPVDWKDAGDALGHDDLKGCLMPNGSDNLHIALLEL